MWRELVSTGLRPSLPLAVTLGAIGLVGLATSAAGQTMPGPAYHHLLQRGHEELAAELARRLDRRSVPSRRDVERLLRRWGDEADGPVDRYDWLAVTRLWMRAGELDRARESLDRVSTDPGGAVLLDRGRIALLEGDEAGAVDYWQACEVADETTSLEAWLDVEALATPAEMEAWDRFRRMPVGDRDDCSFLRRFWNRRAVASGTALDERLAQHYTRLRYALDHYRRRGREHPRFSSRLGRPAHAVFDDRGLLYVRMGEPDDLAVHGGDACIEPNVSWAYDRPGGFRVYHLSPLAGVDDWYLLENLAAVYRCGGADRSPMVALSPLSVAIPGTVLRDLYLSRSGLDPAYARIAMHALGANRLRLLEDLKNESEWTWADGEYAVQTVPERPAIELRVDLGLEWLRFRAPVPGQSRVWLNAMVRAADLRSAPVDGAAAYRLDAVWTLLGADGLFLRRVPHSFELAAPPDPDPEAALSIRLPTDVPPGAYRWSLALTDANATADDASGRRAGGYASGELEVPDLSTDLPILSDVAVSADSTGRWEPGGGISLNPSPAHVTDGGGIAFIYYEAYNLTPGGQYETRVVLAPAGEGADFDLSYLATAAAGGRVVTRGFLRLDLSQTAPGRYRASVTVRDLTSGVATLPARTDILVTRD